MATVPVNMITKVTRLYADGLNVRQISAETGYSINALFYLMRKNNIMRRDAKATSANRFAQKELSFSIPTKLSSEQSHLKLLGTALYWAEGYKTEKSKGIDFANSDSSMVILFLRFLREVCRVDENRIKILLYSHDDALIKEQLNYWSTLLNIPLSNFSKPYIAKTDKTLEKKRKMQYGLVHLRYADKKLLLCILGWIEDLKK
jgi:hypothetical protein